LGDDARSASADTNSSKTYRPASSGSGGGVTPELVLVDPELAQAQRQTSNRKAAMSSTEPANTFPEPAQPAPALAPTPTPAPAEPSMRDVPLGTLIFRAGLLGEEQLENALQEGMRTGKRLGEVLLERGWLNERDLGRMLAGQKGLPFVDVALSDVEADALKALDQDDARRQVALPLFYEDGELVIAVGDPSNELVLESLRREIKTDFQLVVAPHGQLLQVIEEAYSRVDPEPAPQFEGVLFPDLRPRAQEEAPHEPVPQPDLGFAAAVESEVAPELQAEAAPELETPSESEPASEEKPFSGSTPTLLSRMLFPSVRHAAQEAEAGASTEQEVAPEAEPQDAVEQSESPGPAGEDFAELELPAPPEMPVSSFEQQVAESEPETAAPEEAPEPAAETEQAAPEEPSEPVAETEPETAAPEDAPEPAAETEQAAPEEPSEPVAETEPETAPEEAPEPVAQTVEAVSPELSEPVAETEPETAPDEALAPVAETEQAAPEEPSEPEPAPAAEQRPDEAEPTTHVVIVRLRDGEAVRIGEHPNSAAASAQAAETVAQITSAAGTGKWPLFDGRYLSPDTIVSVDLLEESPDA
jgi:type II secretion system (T2SS) protein E